MFLVFLYVCDHGTSKEYMWRHLPRLRVSACVRVLLAIYERENIDSDMICTLR
jgi:hypothetical protein